LALFCIRFLLIVLLLVVQAHVREHSSLFTTMMRTRFQQTFLDATAIFLLCSDRDIHRRSSTERGKERWQKVRAFGEMSESLIHCTGHGRCVDYCDQNEDFYWDTQPTYGRVAGLQLGFQ
jgi:hypothetical protein